MSEEDLLWEIPDHSEVRHSPSVRDCLIELLLQLPDDLRMLQAVEQQRTGRVASRVAAGDQLRQRLGGEFLAAELLATFVPAFHQAREEVDAIDLVGIGEALVYPCDGDASEVLDCFYALGEEGVGEIAGVGLKLRKAADCAGSCMLATEGRWFH